MPSARLSTHYILLWSSVHPFKFTHLPKHPKQTMQTIQRGWGFASLEDITFLHHKKGHRTEWEKAITPQTKAYQVIIPSSK